MCFFSAHCCAICARGRHELDQICHCANWTMVFSPHVRCVLNDNGNNNNNNNSSYTHNTSTTQKAYNRHRKACKLTERGRKRETCKQNIIISTIMTNHDNTWKTIEDWYIHGCEESDSGRKSSISLVKCGSSIAKVHGTMVTAMMVLSENNGIVIYRSHNEARAWSETLTHTHTCRQTIVKA